MEKQLLDVKDVSILLGISESRAYYIIRKCNEELKKQGFITIRGRISAKYLRERVYGVSDQPYVK